MFILVTILINLYHELYISIFWSQSIIFSYMPMLPCKSHLKEHVSVISSATAVGNQAVNSAWTIIPKAPQGSCIHMLLIVLTIFLVNRELLDTSEWIYQAAVVMYQT